MKSPKGTRNENIRKMIDNLMASLPSGARLTTSEISEMFTAYRGTNNRNVSSLLRERDDVKLVQTMLWEKV